MLKHRIRRRMGNLWAATVLSSFAFAQMGLAQAEPSSDVMADVMVVFDASGSMWGQVDGTAKIEVARNVFGQLSADWAARNQPVGLIAYGHRRKGDCADIEVLAKPSVDAARDMAQTVNRLVPRGKTPLSQAVRMAAEQLKFTENAATVVLLSDGIETCDLDPCAVGQDLERLGVDFTAHVIGFDIQTEDARAQLQCLAENTGGSYRDARDADALVNALADATKAPSSEPGMLPVKLGIKVAPDNARPAHVTIRAENLKTGERVAFGTLTDAHEVLSGVTTELPAGTWRFSAEGDEGRGEIDVALSPATEVIDIPFANREAAFVLESGSQFFTDDTITIALRSLVDLPSNETYVVHLLPAGANSVNERITYSNRFGSDQVTTEHSFYVWQYDLAPGAYDIAVTGGARTLANPFVRKTISISEPTALYDITIQAQFADGTIPDGMASWSFYPDGDVDVMAPDPTGARAKFTGMAAGSYLVEVNVETASGTVYAQDKITIGPDATTFAIILERPVFAPSLAFVQEPLTPGMADAFEVTGAPARSLLRFIGLDGQKTVQVLLGPNGQAPVPAMLALGAFRMHLIAPDGTDTFLDTVDILPASAQNIGDHSAPVGEDPSTMISPEELAAENAPRPIPFDIWKDCTDYRPCRISEPRVGLEMLLPPDWAASEPYYYTTAGGGKAKNPTVEMVTLDGSAFMVALNPRQWAAHLGPCEPVPQGRLCREDSLVEKDQKDYATIKDWFLSIEQRAQGWLPLGRSWSMEDSALNRPIGLVSFDEPDQSSDKVRGFMGITNPSVLGLEQNISGPIELTLRWNTAPLLEQISGEFNIGSDQFSIRLGRPGDWDQKTNFWVGKIRNLSNGVSAPIRVY